MIYEIAQLPVRGEKIATFRSAFAKVAPLLIRARGYEGSKPRSNSTSSCDGNRWKITRLDSKQVKTIGYL
jgi:heme-degrading monooxygenase HmoA